MKKLLLVLAFVNATALAASAQTPPAGHGLTLSSPDWTPVSLSYVPFPAGGGGGRRFGRFGRTFGHDSQPHMEQALANALPAPAPAYHDPRRRAKAFRHASAALTNNGAKAVKSVRMDFVFTDPATGAEVNRIPHRSKKRLRPGESALTRREVLASSRHRRGDGMKVSVEVTEVVYEDGSVWRR